jgi:benzodiazapine receptor
LRDLRRSCRLELAVEALLSGKPVNPVVLSLLVCLSAAALEGALAGAGVRRRFAELQLPTYSPPFALWIVIGVLYYALSFLLLWRLLSSAQFTAHNIGALVLLGLIMLFNSGWSILFFRLRTLRGSFLAFFPYMILVISLAAVLAHIYPLGAWLLALYCVYLCYATWWGYRLWRLNAPNA